MTSSSATVGRPAGTAGPVPPEQVVEVRAPRVNGHSRVGSGLLITDRLVLTAAHAVFPDGPVPPRRVDLTVGIGGSGRVRTSGRVVWPERWDGTGGDGDRSNGAGGNGDTGAPDAALVLVDDPDWVPPRVERPRWGVLTGRAGDVRCEAVGFPRVLRGGDGVRETNHLVGHVNPLGGLVTGRYDLSVRDHPPLAPAKDWEPLPWSGMSGAVLFACADPTGPAPLWLACGVIVVDTPGFGEGRLTAVPVQRLLDDPRFRRLVTDGGAPAGWESVELAGLLTPPTVTTARTPAQLLRADAEIVDLRGRDDWLTEFTHWCAGTGTGTGAGGREVADSAVRLLVGPGGQGKTRFARALVTRMRAESWLAGLVRAGGAELAGRLAASTRPVLLVVDYAETHTELVGALLALLEGRSSRTPLRLLLVARGAGDWWDALTRRHALAENGQVLALPPVEGARPDRAALFTDAADRFAAHLADLDPAVDWAGRAHLVRAAVPDLSDPGFGLILAVHMAALTALLDQPGPTTTGTGGHSPGRVADRLLAHEETYWTDTARIRGLDRSADSLAEAVAAATLVGAATFGEALATLARLPGFAGEDGAAHDTRTRAARWLAALYPPTPERAGQLWGGISPDRLAEHFLARQLTAPTCPAGTAAAQPSGTAGGGPGLADRVLTGASAAQGYQALTVLNRAATTHLALRTLLVDLLAADPSNRAPIAARVMLQAADHSPAAEALTAITPQLDRATLTTLVDGLPKYSHRLLGLAATLQRAHTARLREHAPRPRPLGAHPLGAHPLDPHPLDPYRPDLARSLNNLSNRLRDLGQAEAALAAIEEAVAIRRQLAADRPEVYLADLASSTNNLASRLRALGRPEEALAAIEEAVAISRQLATRRPGEYLPDLAMALNNQSVDLGNLGQPERALAAVEEAEAIYRQLAAEQPDVHLPDLAMTLNNQSLWLKDVGRPERALAAVEEAEAIYRRLATDRPDVHLPDLARSLNNLSVSLGDLGRPEQALAAAEEAVTIRRQLAADQPGSHLPDLATSLNNLSVRLGDLRRAAAALAATEEALAIHRRLAADRPDTYRPDLARSLNNLSVNLGNLGRAEEGLAAVEEAVAIRRQLAADRPDAYLPSLALALNNLSVDLGNLARTERALATAEEAVAAYRALATDRPDTYLPHLAMALNNLSPLLTRSGRPHEARSAIEQAIVAYRHLAAERPDAHLPDLAMALHNLANRLAEMGEDEPARTALQEALAIRRPLAAARPRAHRPDLETSLRALALLLHRMGRHAEAEDADRERGES